MTKRNDCSSTLTARSRSTILRLILVIACFTTTAFYFTVDDPATRTLEGDMDQPHYGGVRRSLGDVEQRLEEPNHSSLLDVTQSNHTPLHQQHLHGNRSSIHTNDDTSAVSERTISNTSKSPYAYLFIIGGVDPASNGYRGFLYNVMIADRCPPQARKQGRCLPVRAVHTGQQLHRVAARRIRLP